MFPIAYDQQLLFSYQISCKHQIELLSISKRYTNMATKVNMNLLIRLYLCDCCGEFNMRLLYIVGAFQGYKFYNKLFKYNMKTHWLIALVCVLFCYQASGIQIVNQSAQLLLNYITADNTTILAQSTYTFTFSRFSTASIPLNSYLLLTFDNEYVQKISPLPLCSSSSFGSSQPTCTYSGTALYVNNLFSNSSFLKVNAFTISISNITNPSHAGNYVPVKAVSIISPSSTVIDAGTGSIVLTIDSGIARCDTLILNPYAFKTGQISVTYTSSYLQAGKSYNLSIDIPASYPDDPTNTSIDPIISVPVTLQVNPGVYSYKIQYTNSFTITMLMPPSTKPQNNFISIYSYDEIGNIDTCSISITGIQPNVFETISISEGKVQKLQNITFSLTLTTPFVPTDYININFDESFGLSSLSSSVTILSFGTFLLTRIGNSVLINSITQQPVLYATLVFTLRGILMPYTTATTYINISIQTSDNYYHILQNYAYSAASGQLAASIQCSNTQIGTINSVCLFAITTSSSIASKGFFNIVLPNQFSISLGSNQCSVFGSGLNTFASCSYYPLNNTIQTGSLTSSNAPISPLNLTLGITLNITILVNTYSFRINTLSSGSIVDQGTTSITVTARKLKDYEFNIASSSSTTFTPTIYTFSFSLPIDLGSSLTVSTFLPFRLQSGSSVFLTGASLVSYASQILTVTSNSLTNNATISINNLMTAVSLQGINITINITYLGKLYFYGSQLLYLSKAKNFNTATLSQSNQVVYNNAIATLTVDQVSSGDKIVLISPYSFFYSSNQTSCSSNVICSSSGVITLSNVTSDSTATFTFNIRNFGYVGQVSINVSSYDSSQLFMKQSSLVPLITTTPNSINITANQSNPYFSQQSSYTFNLQLSTPNLSNLLFTLPSEATGATVSGILNCGTPIKLAIGYFFNTFSTNCIIGVFLTNPSSFDSAKFIFKTSNSQGDVDYGYYTPVTPCVSPCRSCIANNKSSCLSCYSWSSFPIFFNSSCLNTCKTGLFSTTIGGIITCTNCSNLCTSCSGSSTNCSACKTGVSYYSNGCFQTCPSGTYLISSTSTCNICAQSECSICNSTVCLSCNTGFSLFNGQCLAFCYSGYYSFKGSCVLCSNLCLGCSPVNGSCASCIDSYLLFNGVCYTNCPLNSFLRVNSNICEVCQPPCSACFNTSTNCLSCLSKYNSTTYFFLSNVCYGSVCPDGYYANTSSRICIKCSSNCPTCTASSCLSCLSPLILYQGVCYQDCPTGTYSDSQSCSSCLSICKTCISSNICLSCISNYKLFNSSCFLTCPTLYYANLTGNVCLQCSLPCQLCNYFGCLTCTEGYYLQGTKCVNFCTDPFHPNNSTMVCENCRSPCSTCTWSDLCLSCITGFSLLGTNCLSSCPSGQYTDGFKCNQCPNLCSSCTFLNNLPACLTCSNNTFSFSFSCIDSCPNSTILTDNICYSSDCSNIPNCLSCSGTRCLQCNALYKMDNTFTCSQSISSSEVLAGILQMPVPFPFLIGIILLLIVSFLLKNNFPKMFSPLFIYSIAGCLQFFCLVMWIILTVLWNINLDSPHPYESIVYAPVIIGFVYITFNVIQFVLWTKIIATDRKYRLWQRQDNRCSSLTIAIFSLIFSFRLDSIKFSKAGHNQHLSARLEQPQKFKQYSILSILSFALSISMIVISALLSYYQSSLNYLFFTGIQITIISIIMIILSISMLCVSRQQLLQDKSQYQIGYDNDQLQSKSIEQMLNGIVVIQQHINIMDDQTSGNAVLRKNEYISDIESQDLTLLQPNQMNKHDSRSQLLGKDTSPKGDLINNIFGFSSQINSQNHILLDDLERNKLQAMKLVKKYGLSQQQIGITYNRNSGAIVKQLFPTSNEEQSQQEDSMHSFQEFQFSKGQWKKENVIKQLQASQPTQNDEQQLQIIKRFQQKAALQELQRKQQQQEKQRQRLQRQLAEQQSNQHHTSSNAQLFSIHKDSNLIVADLQTEKDHNQQLIIERIKEKQQQWRLKKEAEQRQKRQYLQKLRQQKIQLKKKLKEQEMKRKAIVQEQIQRQKLIKEQQIEKVNILNQKLYALQKMQEEYAEKNQTIESEQSKLHYKQEQIKRQSMQQELMAIEDRLSRMTKVFDQMWKKAAILKEMPERKRNSMPKNSNTPNLPNPIEYHNDDNENLVSQISPRKIKVNPSPLPQQYSRKHIFVEEGTDILESSGSEDQVFTEPQVLFNGQEYNEELNNESIQAEVEKLNKRKAHLSIVSKETQEIEELRLKESLSKKPYASTNLRSRSHQQMPVEDSQQPIVMVYENKIEERLEEDDQWSEPSKKQTEEEEKDEIIQDYSARSIPSRSSQSHWPIEPQMEQRILQVQRRANRYLQQPPRNQKKQNKFVIEIPKDQIYEEEEQGQTQLGEIVFEQSDNILDEESKVTGRTQSIESGRKKYSTGRVNRKVFDLSPGK